ncbi:MAG: glycosyltransferase family 61 protein [Pirellulaceae bacterium]|nr:glycosyltransferase family 61 protein [Pirellulaceae bacterium]
MAKTRFWRLSKYLIPLDRSALRLTGAPAPKKLATLDQLAERFPAQVQAHNIGCDHDFGSFDFTTIRSGQVQDRQARAEPPFQLRVFSLTDSTSVGRHSCLLGPENTLVADLGYYLPDNDFRSRSWLAKCNPRYWRSQWLVDLRNRRQLPAVQKLRGTAVLLNNPWCHNYYHWLLEVAPRLMVMRQAGLTADWYVVECQSRFQKRALELLGVPAERLIQPHFGLHLKADQFLRPSHPGLGNWQAMADCILQELSMQGSPDAGNTSTGNTGAGKAAPIAGGRIYISRKAAAHRKVANEIELEKFLAQYGFQSYSFEHLDFAEQVRLIHNAEAIVAVHGAALANLIFARPDTRVVELCPVHRYNTDCFPRMSHKLGHHHVNVLTPSTRFRQQLSVNLTDVAAALDMCGVERDCGLRKIEGRGTQRTKVA